MSEAVSFLFWLAIALVYVYVRVFYFRSKDRLSVQLYGALSQPSRVNQTILSRYFRYYIHLPDHEKARFEKRVRMFMYRKVFVPRKITRVTEEMKVLISACAVQLVFGLKGVHMSHFRRIFIYPDAYYSTINQTYHKGEVNLSGGIIVLSWKHFLEGYINHTSGRNLGLHEMGHALSLENKLRAVRRQYLDPVIMEQWNDLARAEMERIRAGKQSFLRAYAGENEQEFFAVAVEYFFELPEQFKARLPELYDCMVKLLGQDPLKFYRILHES